MSTARHQSSPAPRQDKSDDTDIDLLIATLLSDASDLQRKQGPDCHLGATFEAAARVLELRARNRARTG